MQSTGDTDGGFWVVPSDATGIVRVRGWGFWSPAVASVFVEKVLAGCRATRRPSELVFDADALKPQRDEGQTAIGAMFDEVAKLGVSRISVITSSPLTRLQLARIARAGIKKGVVELRSATETGT